MSSLDSASHPTHDGHSMPTSAPTKLLNG